MKKNYWSFMKGVNWVLAGFMGVMLFACSNDDDLCNPCCSYSSGLYEGYYGSGLYEECNCSGLYEGGYGSGCVSTNGNLKSEEIQTGDDSMNLPLLSPQQVDR